MTQLDLVSGHVEIRGLTLVEPMAWAIAAGHKVVENRRWRPWKGVTHVAIHSGKRYDEDYAAQIRSLGIDVPPRADIEMFYSGRIVALARLNGYVTTREKAIAEVGERAVWFTGPYGWLLTDVVRTRHIVHRGARGLWHLEPEALAECQRLLTAA